MATVMNTETLTDLEAHIAVTDRPPYKKRLKQHLQETKRHAREVERRIKKLGGDAGSPVQAEDETRALIEKARPAGSSAAAPEPPPPRADGQT